MRLFRRALGLACQAMPTREACLFHWRPRKGVNFGDELSIDLVSRMLASDPDGPIPPPACRTWGCRRRLFAVGSILHDARAGDVVWGSGINGKIGSRNYDFSGIDFRAVRGPLTRRMVGRFGGDCPTVFGDPALLLPRLFPELAEQPIVSGERRVTYIPNINDMALLDPRAIQEQGAELMPPTAPWSEIVRKIRVSSLVVGSSLHALVLSDAFGVPCRPCVSLFEAPFKYQDHLLATGRDGTGLARDLAEALQLGPLPPPVIDLEPLLQAFPWDLFRPRFGS